MAEYLAQRIQEGALDYDIIISSKTYGQYKKDIDKILKDDGFTKI